MARIAAVVGRDTLAMALTVPMWTNVVWTQWRRHVTQMLRVSTL